VIRLAAVADTALVIAEGIGTFPGLLPLAAIAVSPTCYFNPYWASARHDDENSLPRSSRFGYFPTSPYANFIR